jgi:predicted PurR-regulated permease PerM
MFFALLGGLRVFGVLGIVLGPVMFAIAASILDVLGDRTALPVVESAAGKLPDDPDTS